MIIGACGVCCSVCRLYVTGVCAGCSPGDQCPIEKAMDFACPILRCATAKSLPFCIRDCIEYPCTFYQDHKLICENYVVGEPQALPDQQTLDSMQFGFRLTGREFAPRLNGGSVHLYIFCLGSLRVFRSGKYITEAEWGQKKGPTQKVKALFAFLLARGARGATKDAIIELLWGDQPVNDKLEARFHATLYYLRHALEPDLPSRAESRYVRLENGFYKLAPEQGYWVDAAAFEDYYHHAQRLEEEGQDDLAMRFWKLAEALYQGDYMIDLAPTYTEDYIDDCCKWQRYRLKDMHLEVLLKLAHHHFRCNQDRLSFIYATKALTEDRGCEEAHRLIMRLMHRAGQRHDLIRQFRLCKRSLAESENRSPSPETVQLYQQLIQTLKSGNYSVSLSPNGETRSFPI